MDYVSFVGGDVSTLSSIPSFVAMSLISLWIACVVSGNETVSGSRNRLVGMQL